MSPNRKRSFSAVVAVSLLALAAGGGAVAATKAEQTIAARQAGYKQIGGAFKAINDQLKSGSPDTRLIAANAKTIHDLSLKAPSWFPKGSGPEAGVKTKAKAEIWTDSAKFAAAMKTFQTESAKLQQVAAKGDVGAIQAQVRAVGGSCGGCHKPFREE